LAASLAVYLKKLSLLGSAVLQNAKWNIINLVGLTGCALASIENIALFVQLDDFSLPALNRTVTPKSALQVVSID
jgi:hypothetical protein